MVNFDDTLREIGEFGRYQKFVFTCLCFVVIVNGFRLMINVYILNVPAHRCAIPGYPNDTYAVQSHHHAVLINDTIPYVTRDGHLEYDQCHVYVNNTGFDYNRTTVACDKWVYDRSVFESTAAAEMNMVCGNSLEAPSAQMIFMTGILVGGSLFGFLSDKIGRRITLMLSIALLFAGGVGLTWATTYPIFVTLRFVNGAASSGIYLTCYVLGMELVGPSKRLWAGMMINICYTVGYVLMTALAFIMRDWQTLELAMGAPIGIFLVYWWFIPESPRWLLSKRRHKEAEVIIHRMAEVNKVAAPELTLLYKNEATSMHVKTPKSSIALLFTSRVLLTRTMVIFFSWIIVSLAYFGLSTNADQLGSGNVHLNSLLASLVEFPANFLCLLLLDRLGRKILFCLFMFLGGAACISTVFSTMYAANSVQWITIMLAMIGKLCAAGAFSVIYVLSSEIFPTVVRNSALGLCSSCARIGGMIAPYILDLDQVIEGKFGKALPMGLFGCLAVVSGLLGLTLPETLNRDLPETIEDAKHFKRRKLIMTVGSESGSSSSQYEDESEPLLADKGKS